MHLRLFELAKDALNRTGLFDVIAGFISPVNDAYGKEGLLPAKHRLEMIRLATQTSDWIKLDDWEAKQPEWQRTRLVLDNAKERLSKGDPLYSHLQLNGSSARIKLLCGADMLESFAVPDLWSTEDVRPVFLFVHIVVVVVVVVVAISLNTSFYFVKELILICICLKFSFKCILLIIVRDFISCYTF